MAEYLLVTLVKGSLGNAGPKAPRDICKILKEEGMVDTLSLSSEEGLDFPIFLQLYCLLKEARENNKNIILQYPLQPYLYHEMQKCYSDAFRLLDPERTAILIHDINQIRFAERAEYHNEMEWLGRFHNFIVHNERMEKYLRRHINIKKCVRNEIFDYLCEDKIETKKERKIAKGSLCIVFAGNLDYSKAPFLHNLEEDKMNFYMNVYGRRSEVIKNTRINYCGSFEADVLPSRMRGDLGLIWDGMVKAKEDHSAQKNYTRYNTPHKFSCYMAAGIPVIAWREAAIADVIEKYQVGYLIDDLYEINELDLSKYREYQKNAMGLSDKVRRGYFTKRGFEELMQ